MEQIKRVEFLNELSHNLFPKNKPIHEDTHEKESIMQYSVICEHDSGYMCEHRAECLLNKITEYDKQRRH